MNRPFAVFDIDGTIFRSSLFLELTYRAVKQGVLPESLLTEIATSLDEWHKRKNSEAYPKYVDSTVKAFEKNIIGVKAEAMSKIAVEVVREMYEYTYVYTRDLLKDLKSKGYFLIAITGSHEEVARAFANYYDFDFVSCSVLEIKNGRYTGKGKSAEADKKAVLKKIIKDNSLGFTKSIAVGDTLKDAGLLESVEKPIAFNPSKELFEEAKQKGWKVVVERKNMIYELEPKNGSFLLAKTNA